MIGPNKPNIKIKKKTLFVGLLYLVILVIIAGIVIWLRQPDKNVVFSIGGTSYSQKTVTDIISYPLKRHVANRDTLSKQTFNYLRREQAARELNIEPSKREISQAESTSFGPQLSDQLKHMTWIRLVSYDRALQANLDSNNLDQYEGYSYIFWFGQHMETGPAYTVPDFGNKQLIAKDRSYALGRANYYYGKLKNKQMAPDAVLKAVQNDPKLGFALPNGRFMSQSVHFGSDSEQSWRAQVVYPDIINYIAGQSAPGLSNVRTGKIGIVSVPQSPTDYADGYFYVVELDAAKQVPANTARDFPQTVSKVKARYNGW